METGLACASSSVAPLPRRCYNYSSVNSLPIRRKPDYLQPVCIHQPLAKDFLRDAKRERKIKSHNNTIRRKRSLKRATSAGTYGKYLIIKSQGGRPARAEMKCWRFFSMSDGLSGSRTSSVIAQPCSCWRYIFCILSGAISTRYMVLLQQQM